MRERRRRQNACSLIAPSYKVRNRFISEVCMSSILINELKFWSIDYKYILPLHNHLLDDNRIMKIHIYVNSNIHDISVINLSIKGFVLLIYIYTYIKGSKSHQNEYHLYNKLENAIRFFLLFYIIPSLSISTLSTFQVNHIYISIMSCKYIYFLPEE